jgi:hypothetical protein
MSTRRKAHPDHYQTHPAVPHEPGTQPRHYPRPPAGERHAPHRPRQGEHGVMRAGEHASHPLVLHCAQCGASAAVLADQQVAVCRECGGETYRLSA